MKLLKIEFIKIIHSRRTLLVILILTLVASFFLSKSNVVSHEELIAVYGKMPITVLQGLPGLENVATVEEALAELWKAQMPQVFAGAPSGVMVIAIVFAPYFICSDFGKRNVNEIVYAGINRSEYFGAKVFIYFVCGIIMGNLALMFNLFAYAGHWLDLPGGYIFRCFVIFDILLLGCMSLPVLVSFIVKEMNFAFFISAAAYFLSYLFGNPVRAMSDVRIWERSDSAFAFPSTAILLAFLYLAGCLAASYFVFNRKELK